MRRQTTLLLTLAALVVGVVAFASFAGAQEPTEDPSAGPTEGSGDREDRRERFAAERDDLLQAFADELGVTVEEIEDAAQAVAGQRIDQAVEEGDLTEEQADRLRARIDDGGGLRGLLGGPRGLGGGRGGWHDGGWHDRGPGRGFTDGPDDRDGAEEATPQASSAA